MAYTRKVIEQVFGGRPLEDIFESFDPEPMGIGAVAQVYSAQLRADLVPPPKVDVALLAQADDTAHWWRAWGRRVSQTYIHARSQVRGWSSWLTGQEVPFLHHGDEQGRSDDGDDDSGREQRTGAAGKVAQLVSVAPLKDEATKIGKHLTAPFEQDPPPEPVFTGLVAIKVLHPNVHRTIKRDIKIMSFFARLISFFPGAEWISLPEEVDVFAGMMMSQLDLRNEAENLLHFTANFAHRRSAVTFPQPLVQFTTKELLIETWENAVPLAEILKRTGRGRPHEQDRGSPTGIPRTGHVSSSSSSTSSSSSDEEGRDASSHGDTGGPFDHRLADIGLDAFLSMLLRDNFTHADLHPGNIMVKFYKPTTQSILKDVLVRIMARWDSDYVAAAAKAAEKGRFQEDELVDNEVTETLRRAAANARGQEWAEEMERLDRAGYLPQLVLLDAGLTVELSMRNRQNFIDLFAAIASFDGPLAAKLMAERSRYPDKVVDQAGFEEKMAHLLQRVRASTFKLGAIQIGDILAQTLTLVRRHHVKMEADFVNTVLSILLLEGIGRQLDPELDVFARSLPVLRSVGKEISVQSVLDDGSPGGLHLPKVTSGEWGEIKKFLPMIRLYLFLEARNWANQIADPRLVDAWVRYDWFASNC